MINIVDGYRSIQILKLRARLLVQFFRKQGKLLLIPNSTDILIQILINSILLANKISSSLAVEAFEYS